MQVIDDNVECERYENDDKSLVFTMSTYETQHNPELDWQ